MTNDDQLMPWLPDSLTELRFRLTMLLAPIYMTTSTATVQATVDADAANDARRLDAAVRAVTNTLAEDMTKLWGTP